MCEMPRPPEAAGIFCESEMAAADEAERNAAARVCDDTRQALGAERLPVSASREERDPPCGTGLCYDSEEAAICRPMTISQSKMYSVEGTALSQSISGASHEVRTFWNEVTEGRAAGKELYAVPQSNTYDSSGAVKPKDDCGVSMDTSKNRTQDGDGEVAAEYERHPSCSVNESAMACCSQFQQSESTVRRRLSLVCRFCNKSFSSSFNRKTHERIHTGERPFVCKTCGKNFSQLGTLQKHERIHTGERPYACSLCPMTFIDSSQLRHHERIHTNGRPYACKFCEETFINSSDLQKHEHTHTGERPHVCRFCEKTFTKASVLRQHERIHSGERPHACKFCEKTFIKSSDLRNHVRIHTGERPHMCTFCEKTFIQSSDLQKHLRIHTGERPHVCKICQKAFSNSSNLRKHERIHISGRLHFCKSCQETFADASDFRSHKCTHRA